MVRSIDEILKIDETLQSCVEGGKEAVQLVEDVVSRRGITREQIGDQSGQIYILAVIGRAKRNSGVTILVLQGVVLRVKHAQSQSSLVRLVQLTHIAVSYHPIKLLGYIARLFQFGRERPHAVPVVLRTAVEKDLVEIVQPALGVLQILNHARDQVGAIDSSYQKGEGSEGEEGGEGGGEALLLEFFKTVLVSELEVAHADENGEEDQGEEDEEDGEDDVERFVLVEQVVHQGVGPSGEEGLERRVQFVLRLRNEVSQHQHLRVVCAGLVPDICRRSSGTGGVLLSPRRVAQADHHQE